MSAARQFGFTLSLAAAILCAIPAAQAERLPNRRAVPAPVVSANYGGANPEQLLELLQQIETLQGEIQRLQNQVEIHAHEIDRLKSRQRDSLGDLDRRIQLLEKRPAVEQAAVPANLPVASSTGQEQQSYDTAFNLMKQGAYEPAAKAFQDFLGRYPSSPLADNAQYWLGEAHYVLRNFKGALQEFSKLLQVYPNSLKLPDALLKLGYVHYELGDWGKARKTFEGLLRDFPGSNAAKLAEKRLEKMQKEGR